METMETDKEKPVGPSPETTWARPVTRLTAGDAPSAAYKLNVEGRKVVGALQGFGQLWQKTYRVRLTGCDTSPADVMEVWKTYFPMFQPRNNHFYPSFAGVQPGEMLFFDTTLPILPGLPGMVPFASGVMVLYADDESFTVMTPEGFVVAGWNTFSAFRDDDGTVVAQVQSLERATDPIYEFGNRFMGGAEHQERTWFHVLRSLAAYLGVEEPQVSFERVCVDPKVQWRYATNVIHNGAIRTFFYVLSAPVRSLRQRLARRWATPEPEPEPESSVAAEPPPTPEPETPRDAEYWATPVDRLDTSGLPTEADAASISGRRMAGALQGFGQLWQKRYRIRLDDADAAPGDVIEVWKQKFPLFWPSGPRFYAPLAGIAPGEVAGIDFFADRPVHFSTGVVVIYADDESFTYMTPEGHLFAGWITFSAFRDEDDCTVAQAEVLIRPSDPLFELIFRLGGSRQEDLFWEQTLRNVAAYFGVRTDVETRSVCLDPQLQWSRIGNIRYNAAIRSLLHTVNRTTRRIVRRIAGRRREEI